MTKALGFFAIALPALMASGCAKIPPQAIEVNSTLRSNISDAEAKHIALVELFFNDRKQVMDDWFLRVYEPQYLAKYTQLWNAAHPGDPFDLSKPAQRLAYIQDVIASYDDMAKRVDASKGDFIEKLHQAYGSMLRQNEAVGNLLKSAASVSAANVKAWDDTVGTLIPRLSTATIDADIARIKQELLNILPAKK